MNFNKFYCRPIAAFTTGERRVIFEKGAEQIPNAEDLQKNLQNPETLEKIKKNKTYLDKRASLMLKETSDKALELEQFARAIEGIQTDKKIAIPRDKKVLVDLAVKLDFLKPRDVTTTQDAEKVETSKKEIRSALENAMKDPSVVALVRKNIQKPRDEMISKDLEMELSRVMPTNVQKDFDALVEKQGSALFVLAHFRLLPAATVAPVQHLKGPFEGKDTLTITREYGALWSKLKVRVVSILNIHVWEHRVAAVGQFNSDAEVRIWKTRMGQIEQELIKRGELTGPLMCPAMKDPETLYAAAVKYEVLYAESIVPVVLIPAPQPTPVVTSKITPAQRTRNAVPRRPSSPRPPDGPQVVSGSRGKGVKYPNGMVIWDDNSLPDNERIIGAGLNEKKTPTPKNDAPVSRRSAEAIRILQEPLERLYKQALNIPRIEKEPTEVPVGSGMYYRLDSHTEDLYRFGPPNGAYWKLDRSGPDWFWIKKDEHQLPDWKQVGYDSNYRLPVQPYTERVISTEKVPEPPKTIPVAPVATPKVEAKRVAPTPERKIDQRIPQSMPSAPEPARVTPAPTEPLTPVSTRFEATPSPPDSVPAGRSFVPTQKELEKPPVTDSLGRARYNDTKIPLEPYDPQYREQWDWNAPLPLSRVELKEPSSYMWIVLPQEYGRYQITFDSERHTVTPPNGLKLLKAAGVKIITRYLTDNNQTYEFQFTKPGNFQVYYKDPMNRSPNGIRVEGTNVPDPKISEGAKFNEAIEKNIHTWTNLSNGRPDTLLRK
jgi:hypothetical protein